MWYVAPEFVDIIYTAFGLTYIIIVAPVARRLAQGLQANGVAMAVKVTPFRCYTTR